MRPLINAMRMEKITKLKDDPVLRTVFEAVNALGVEGYLVGGVLRNLFLSSPLGFDYDIALSGKAKNVADILADRLNGSAFLLDKELGFYRINVKKDSGIFEIDLSPYKGDSIIDDVKNRDFTINAVAVNINALFTDGKVAIIDMFDGRGDALKKIIRAVKEDIFDDDPLRLLRAVRLSAQYNLTIENNTDGLIKKKAELLAQSSWERIRDEFFAILSCARSYQHLERLHELSLLRIIIPESNSWKVLYDYDLMSHTLKTLREGEELLTNLSKFTPEFVDNIKAYLKIPLGNISIESLFKFALFLHDAGKPLTMKRDEERIRFIGHELEGETICKGIGKRLKLSRSAIGFIARLVRNHHRVFNLASLDKPTNRSKAHLFRVMGDGYGLLLVLLALADARATRNGDDPELASLVKGLIEFYYKVYTVVKPRPVLNGSEIMEIFDIPEGVMIGKILKILAEAEGEGTIKTRPDAIKFIEGWLKAKQNK